ncbi:MAG: LytTR family DNA-binding domain-containing protein [Oscillospiraceae bacterium]
MKIAICDDDKDELLYISSIINAYRLERTVSLRCDAFNSATELLSTAKSGSYDLYLLDVIMPAVSGMETAKEIRGFDRDAAIVFLTSSPEFAVESYQYKAQDYLLKPAKAAQIYALLDTLFAKTQKPPDGFGVKTKNGMGRILFDKLVFLEVMGRCLYFHLSDGSVREALASLAEFEDTLLARPEFIRTHRAYIVNLLQVAELNANEAITLTGNRVPVSRKNYSKVREAYIAQLFSKKAVK